MGAPPHGAGIVCVPMASAVGRFDDFYTSLERLEIPALVVGAANGKGIVKVACSNVASTLNYAARACVADPQREWVWFLNDDHTFDPGLLIRLLDRQVDVVTPLVAERHHPYGPLMFKGLYGPRYAWGELPPSGLYPMPGDHFAGSTGMVVRRHVLLQLADPYFRLGQYEPETQKEDIYFAQSLVKAGVPIHVDCDEVMGHLNVFDVQPSRDPRTGHWRAAILTSGDAPRAIKPTVFADVLPGSNA